MISGIYLSCPYDTMVNSSKDGILLQIRRWSQIALSCDGLTFLNVKSEISISSPDLTSKFYLSHHSRKNWILQTNVYIPLQTLSRKVSLLLIRKRWQVSFDFWKQFEAYNNEKQTLDNECRTLKTLENK